MSVFTKPIGTVKLPVRYGHPPQGLVSWAIVFDLDGADPWVRPCPGCTVIETDGSYQAGCDECRDRGWFDTTTGLPARMWWFYFDTDRVNWMLRELVPALLRAAGYDADADRVLALRKVTIPMLAAKRVTGTGLLEDITARLHADWWDRLEVAPGGGRITVPASPSFHVGAESFHPALLRASHARWDFATSKLGWWAYRVVWAAVDLLRTRQHCGDTTAADVEDLLNQLENDYQRNHQPLLLIEEDRIHGPNQQHISEADDGAPVEAEVGRNPGC